MTSFGRKLEKCILMMTFIAVVLNFINLILYSNEHRIEVKHFLQTNFKISFWESLVRINVFLFFINALYAANCRVI